MTAPALPPLPAAFPFQQPLDGIVVPLAELDYFTWPSMSGEKYAPAVTLASGHAGGYARHVAYFPAVGLDAGGSTADATSTITWPAVPGASPRSGVFDGLTIQAAVLLAVRKGSITSITNRATFDLGPLGAVEIENDGSAGQLGTQSAVVGDTAFPAPESVIPNSYAGSGQPPTGNGFRLKATLDTTGTRKIYIDGALVESGVQALPAAPIQLTASVFSSSSSTNSASVYVGQLKVSYGPPA